MFSGFFKDDSDRKIVLGLLIISIFIFLITTLIFTFSISGEGNMMPEIFKPVIQYHVEFMVLMGLFGVLSGFVVYNILNSTIEKQKKAAKANANVLLKFLAGDDKAIMKLLLEKGGMTTQTEIAKLNNMGRLRAHRAVRRFEERGIVYVEKHGKINLVRLSEELRQD
jgi:uncharacterized membrane protein